MSQLYKTLHPMTIGDILDRSIQLYRDNFLNFVGIVLLVKGPYLILAYVLTESILTIRLLEMLFVGPVMIAAMTMAISERFLDRDAGIVETYRRILVRFFPLLGTILLAGVAIGVGFLFFVIPGLIFWIWFVFVPQTVVIEGEGGVSAMKRSKYLVKGYFARAFALVILIALAVTLVTEIISFGVERMFSLLGQYGILLAEGASNVVSVLLEPFRIAAMTLLYYDFRIRKEGFDLEIMAEELESGADYYYDV